MRFRRVALIIFLLVLFCQGRAGAGGSRIKVIILPFDMHAGADISGERRALMDALATGLKTEGADIVGIEKIKELVLKGKSTGYDEKAAIDISKSVPADFAVFGSVTRLGAKLNLDLRAFDIKGRSTVVFYTKSAPSLPVLLGMIRDASTSLYEKLGSALKEKPVVKKGIVERVEVSGNRRVDTAAIKKKLTSREGEPFSPDNVKDDIRTLYGMGYFEDISVDLSATASGKVLTFNVKERPFVKNIILKGNKEVDRQKIMDAVTIKESAVLDRAAVGENTERIKAVYASEGFYLAEVTPEIKSDGLEATVIFNIKEGDEVKVKRITFIGNKAFSDRKLRGVMNTKRTWLFSIITQSDRFDEFQFQNDLALVLGKYYDNGYINVEILDHRVLLGKDKRWFYITIALKEGEQYAFGDIDIDGDILGTKKDLLEKLKIKKGETFSRAKLTRDLDTIGDVYGDKGYAYADIKPLTAVHSETKTVDITFDIKKNELVYIEKINIAGNTRTRDKVIRRQLEIEEEKLYSSSAIKSSRGNLKRLGYFDDVSIRQTRAGAPDRIDLNVSVKERPTGSISAGIGYSSVDNLIGTASISQSNFMGTGISLDLSGTVSSSSSRFILGFTQPWLFDKPISAGFDIYNTENEFQDFTTRKKGFDVRFGFPLVEKYTKGFLAYTLEEVNVFDVDENASTVIKDQQGFNTESSIKFTVKRDSRDDAFFPRHGSVITYSSKFAGGFLGGTIFMIKNELDAVKYFPLPWDTTFSMRGAVGYLQGYGGREPPIYERYFLGGINSIRGFDTRTISPKDPDTGDLIGGNSMIQANLEFVFPLVREQKLRGLIFFDAGNAYKGRIDLADLRKAAGFGVRWYSPVGPLRVEFGVNLDRRDDEKSTQWDFTIGSAF